MRIRLLIVLLIAMLALPASALADGCVWESVPITGSGTAVQGFQAGEAYLGVTFSEPMEDLFFVVLNINYPYDILYQGIEGFSAVIYLPEGGDPDYTYLAGGYRCAMAYRAYLPLVIDE